MVVGQSTLAVNACLIRIFSAFCAVAKEAFLSLMSFCMINMPEASIAAKVRRAAAVENPGANPRVVLCPSDAALGVVSIRPFNLLSRRYQFIVVERTVRRQAHRPRHVPGMDAMHLHRPHESAFVIARRCVAGGLSAKALTRCIDTR